MRPDFVFVSLVSLGSGFVQQEDRNLSDSPKTEFTEFKEAKEKWIQLQSSSLTSLRLL